MRLSVDAYGDQSIRSREVTGYPWATQCGFWEPNLNALQEQSMPLTTKPLCSSLPSQAPPASSEACGWSPGTATLSPPAPELPARQQDGRWGSHSANTERPHWRHHTEGITLVLGSPSPLPWNHTHHVVLPFFAHAMLFVKILPYDVSTVDSTGWDTTNSDLRSNNPLIQTLEQYFLCRDEDKVQPRDPCKDSQGWSLNHKDGADSQWAHAHTMPLWHGHQ